MKAAVLIVLSLSALAMAGPAFNKNTNNQIEADKLQQQQLYSGDVKQTQTIETLKHWCFSSQMSQPELTSSFKKLVGIVKSQPEDTNTESAVMSERICQGAIVQKSQQTGETLAQKQADANAHELIKDVYMDALMACESRECMQQLLKIVNSNQVDTIRASYYMTRLAVTDKDSIKDEVEVKQLAESFLNEQMQPQSEAIERQKMLAVAATIGKSLKAKFEANKSQQQKGELEQIAQQVAKTIVARYVKPVSSQEVQQYKEQPFAKSADFAKKIAKRNAALKALANIPGWILSECQDVQQVLVELAMNKQELSTVRQSAIECLEQNDLVIKQLKQLTYDHQEPTEVRIAAFRALMSSLYAGKNKDEQSKQQLASQTIDEIVKHCEQQRNQDQDEQFVVYVISHLDNMRVSQQPEYQAIKECIFKNKQHYMQIQILCKKFQQKLQDVRKYSRNYKLEQEFNQIESGLIIEGDIIYGDNKLQQQQQQQQDWTVLPKLVRVNMSMPVMGETVNMVEITVRQNQMDEELMGALKLVQMTKFNAETVTKVVDSFKQSVEQQQQQQQQRTAGNRKQQQQQVEADLTIKVDGANVVYLCKEDFASESWTSTSQHQGRQTRSVEIEGLLEQLVQHLKRRPVNFNRGFNFNINERIAKLLDVEASMIAGLRFESRAQGESADNFEIVAQMEPRFAFEAIVGPAKMSQKKLLQRVSTKTAAGLRLRFKRNELVDIQLDLPMNTMELFTVETQMVEAKTNSYSYLADSIYGQEDIYSPLEELSFARQQQLLANEDSSDIDADYYATSQQSFGLAKSMRKFKSSIFGADSSAKLSKTFAKLVSGKSFSHSIATHDQVARLTGLRGKLRVAGSPKDMSFLCQCIVQKIDPRMEGFRVQVAKIERSSEQQQVLMSVSTPGSRVERTIQVRLAKQTNNQRSLIKADVQSPVMALTGQLELIHDSRQYAVKVQLESTRGHEMRHSIELGVQRGSQSASGRVATSYKPYFSIDSTSLKRPIAMQGVVSYQQQPKTVISYEFKCPTSGNFVQGKLIVEQRPTSQKYAKTGTSKRSQTPVWRRSMASPLELVLEHDIAITGELSGQLNQHTIRTHQMVEWDAQKWALQFDRQLSHKNSRTGHEQQWSMNAKLDSSVQQVTVQRKCPQQARNEFRFQVVSDTKSPIGHQLGVELRYNSNKQSVVAYKHKLDYSKIASSKLELGYQVELIVSERNINEKIQGRSQINWERRQKTITSEMSGHGKSAKLDLDWQSIESHKFEMTYTGQEVQHRCQVRTNKGQVSVQSRTEKRGQTLAKLVLELSKPTAECQLLIELPTEASHVAVDVKLASGKLSSWALQTPRFASKAEFSFETLSRPFAGGKQWYSKMMPMRQLRLKTDLKDLVGKQAYWMDSKLTQDDNEDSFVRLDSPAYRTEWQFSPSEQASKFGLFARNKRSLSQDNYDQLYNNDDSIISGNNNNKWIDSIIGNNKQQRLSPMELGQKLWAVRSYIASPVRSASSGKLESLKDKAMRSVFEYADRRQQHKHQLDWAPEQRELSWMLEHAPSHEFGLAKTGSKAMRFSGLLSPSRNSVIDMDSEWTDVDFEAKPYDGQFGSAKLNVLSRHPRSAFKKHESEIRYEREHGIKGQLKHQDKHDQVHQWQFEADQQPAKWAKINYDGDKHGRGSYEHKWRKHVTKRSIQGQDEDFYANKLDFAFERPADNWSHQTSFDWLEPASSKARYDTIDYLKRVEARLASANKRANSDDYKLDFDYQPQSSFAKLDVSLPEDMLHSSKVSFKPEQRQFNFDSKYVNRRSQEPEYKFELATKPWGIATANQEAQFFQDQHPMLGRPIGSKSVFANIFKQPLKLDYSDKFGRQARLDYDESPIRASLQGLRQKRAAVYYKDEQNKLEHQSSYDFYPEPMIAGFQPSYKQQQQQQQGPIVLKTETKLGPVAIVVDSDERSCELKLVSPIIVAKLTGEASKQSRAKLWKLSADNKQQQVQLAKIVRKTPVLKHSELAKELAKQFDDAKFEHQSELLVSLVEQIFKLKSQTTDNKRPVMTIDGELNLKQDKLIVKVDGKRTEAQIVLDLVTKSANLVLSVDDKRTVHHQTRLVRLDNKFFSLDSTTTYKQKPIAKIVAKISAMIFEEPAHFFNKKGYTNSNEHATTFEATIYEPKPVQVTGTIDCTDKQVRIAFKDLDSQRVSNVRLQLDNKLERVFVEGRVATPKGSSYQIQKSINIAPLVRAY